MHAPNSIYLKIESSYTNLSPYVCMSIFVCVEETKIQRNKEGKIKEYIWTLLSLIFSGNRECFVSFSSLASCGLVGSKARGLAGTGRWLHYHIDDELLDLRLIYMYTSILYKRLHKFGAVEVVDLVPVKRWLDGIGSTTLDQNCTCWLSVTRFEMAGSGLGAVCLIEAG